jgi:hypothetical protein
MLVPETKNAIASGTPMSVKQMETYLQDFHGFPVAVRQQGTNHITCPYCKKHHHHDPGSGHYEAQCEEENYGTAGIVIGSRSFIPAYGYTIIEYEEVDGVNRILNY